jgi:hypothetical protein
MRWPLVAVQKLSGKGMPCPAYPVYLFTSRFRPSQRLCICKGYLNEADAQSPAHRDVRSPCIGGNL